MPIGDNLTRRRTILLSNVPIRSMPELPQGVSLFKRAGSDPLRAGQQYLAID
jgi:hypothetical protein